MKQTANHIKHLTTLLLAAWILVGCGKESTTEDDGLSVQEQEMIAAVWIATSDAWPERGDTYVVLAHAYAAQQEAWERSFEPEKRDKMRYYALHANTENNGWEREVVGARAVEDEVRASRYARRALVWNALALARDEVAPAWNAQSLAWADAAAA